MSASTPLRIDLPDDASVSALLDTPPGARTAYVFAHGAGVGMEHAFMAGIAAGLAARGVATLRFQFPYMERGSKRPDSARVAQTTVRAAVQEAARRLPGVALFAGGKSFGGRMTSEAQAQEPLPGVRGLVFLGFPLHPPEEPSIKRAAHLDAVQVPMLFLQGTRDRVAELALVQQVTQRLGARATLHEVAGGDHSFDVLVRSGRTPEEVRAEVLETMANWMRDRT
jgi:uncharacterized protein